jgi:RHS repeat-associated protein
VNGRVTGISYTDVILPPMEPFANDESTREYDASGNMTVGRQAREGSEYLRQSVTRNWYGADETLRATQTSDGEGPSLRGVWEEYRYDPLGRRILVRSVRSGLCTAAGELCLNTITRYVWSGDQILWEMRVPGADGDNLEATTATGVPSGHQIRYGRVSYFHAGGIDRPLSIRKDEGTSIIPHTNWRGLFAWGTWGAGSLQGVTSDCQSGVPPTNCVNLAWPGWQTSAWHVDGNAGETEYWMGSLVDGMRDASGQIYMRNRYYDPATGQFTQQDPIGLAGGLNAYGFAAGDPVTYSDPYGLTADDCAKVECPKSTRAVIENKQVQQFAQELMQASMMDSEGAEYGAFVVRESDGSLGLAHVTRGGVGTVRLPDAPDNAIARIHTHPDQPISTGLTLTFESPSGSDVVNANADNVYGIVVTPRNFHVIPVGQNTYHTYPRTQTLMPPAGCPARITCSSPYK